MVKFGLYLPNYGAAANARALSELAAEAETAGWDGFFLWDHILGEPPKIHLCHIRRGPPILE